MKPQSEYYAVIFSSTLSGKDVEEYRAMAARMEELAARQPGYIGIESARGDAGFGLTISYWKDESSILSWKRNAEHLLAQRLGREKWYSRYSLRIARVGREYHYPSSGTDAGT